MSLRLHTGGETRSCTIRCHWTPPPPPPPPPHLSLSTCQLHSTTCSGVFGGFRGGLWSLTFPLLADHRKAFGCEEGVHECKFSMCALKNTAKKTSINTRRLITQGWNNDLKHLSAFRFVLSMKARSSHRV